MFFNSSLRGTRKFPALYDIAERAGIRVFFTSNAYFNTSRQALGHIQGPKAAEV
jgi:hypothetical protein